MNDEGFRLLDRAQHEQLRLLESAVSRLNDIIIITEAEPIERDGPRIVFVNDAFVRLTGFSREEAIGNTPRMLQGPKTERGECDRIHAALQAWQPVRAEVTNYAKDGREIAMELDIVPIANAAGWYTHWVSVQRDVTERKLAALRSNEMALRLKTLVTNAKVGILVHRNFKPIVVNDEYARIFGYADTATVLAMPDIRVLLADAEWQRAEAFNGSRLKGEPVPALYSVKGKARDGSIMDLENRSFAIQWGEETAVCAMVTDVTDQRRMEEQLRLSQRLDAIGQLTGGIAHDFNNLLTVILGNAEFLADCLADDENLRPLAEMTKNAAERGAELTSRMLAFARKQALDPKATDVNALLSGMDGLLRRTLGEHIDIQSVRGEALWEAMVDAPQLESALLNLCINARDAMPRGGLLTIETRNATLDEDYTAHNSEAASGEYVMLAVSDTGTGMAPDTMAQVFEPFFTTKDVGKGSGLGLSMIYGFLKQSRGHVKLYSELGQGTTAKLYLPRAQDGAAHAEPENIGGKIVGGSETILLVEDDDLVRVHVAGQLQGLGYRVVGARNGREALAALGAGTHFDLLFTDVVMPGGMNGRELAEAATKQCPGLPVLFTSGYTEDAMVHHGRLDFGMQLLNKPYSRKALAAKIRMALSQATTLA
jgi:PAS domain S-box-containing protein